MENKIYKDPYPKMMKMLNLSVITLDRGKITSITTPPNIIKDMIVLLPEKLFNKESKFLDICCKSGILLISIRERLMNSQAMIEAVPDYSEQLSYIKIVNYME